MKNKRSFWTICCVALVVAIAVVGIWIWRDESRTAKQKYADGVEQIDLNTIYLEESGVEVEFAEVILGRQEETRKLIVSTQEATVSMMLTDRIINKLDFDFLKKTQNVSYTGCGFFVVDLDRFTRDSVVEDHENKIITIRIPHAYLQAIEIDPNKIMIDEVKEGLLARGDIELSIKDYNYIEKELRTKLETKFNTVVNGQTADDTALRMVKEVYEPVIKAIDRSYSVRVEFE